MPRQKQYNPKAIEKKWREKWEQDEIYKTPNLNKTDKKFYSLYSFPYPSGAGLHVGHAEGMVANDIAARYHRMKGDKTILPMGWDSFGLPAENFAIKTGTKPKKSTEKAIKTFIDQIKKLGISVDWETEVGAHRPDYYKWTQWIFLQLYKKGLAYQKTAPVNWCPSCQTALANEQVIDGKCERCDTEVEKKPMKQWFFKITDYAEKLEKDLDKVDWPESTKIQQRNWIGKSEGAKVSFKIERNTDRNKSIVSKEDKTITLKVLENLKQIFEVAEKEGVKFWVLGGLACAYYSGEIYRKHDDLDLVSRNVKEREKLIKILNKLGFKKISEKKVDHLVSVPTYKNSYGMEIDLGLDLGKYGLKKEDFKENVLELEGVKSRVLSRRFILNFKKSQVKKRGAKKDRLDLEMMNKNILNKDNLLDNSSLEIFTTRPDTLFGCTYMVVCPEHKLVENYKSQITNLDEVKKYILKSKKKSDLQRTDLNKDKTGVEIKGVRAINPVNGEEVPIFIADYVLPGYGTGAIMAVPAHDERDYEFAKKYNIPTKQVVAPYFPALKGDYKNKKDVIQEKRDMVYAIVKNPKDEKYLILDGEKYKWKAFVAGGIENNESLEIAARREVLEETGYKNLKFIREFDNEIHTEFYAPHKNVNRYASIKCVLFELESNEKDQIEKKELDQHKGVWIKKEKLIESLTFSNHKYFADICLNNEKAWTNDGIAINSKILNGLKTLEAKKKIIKWLEKNKVGQRCTTFKLRDWLVSRQRYWGAPIPIVYDPNGKPYPVDEKDLPVLLPEDVDFKPHGESPLVYSKDFHKSAEEKYGKGWRREVDTMDTFVDSSWYYFRHLDPKNNKKIVNKEKADKWLPTDLYMIGAEHIVLHLLYSRFFTKFFKDQGLISFDEPFYKMRHMGMIQGADNRKMSKRWGNIINPSDEVKKYGADTLRMYEMFMGPLSEAKAWSVESEEGVFRFLKKIWNLQYKVKEKVKSEEQESWINKVIKKVNEDMKRVNFNTTIASFMEFSNFLLHEKEINQSVWKRFLQVMAPFAPYITEELWIELGNKKSIHISGWPKVDESKIKAGKIEVVLQVNGKVRDKVQVGKEITQKEGEKMIIKSDRIQSFIKEKKVKRIIVVKGRLVNVVV